MERISEKVKNHIDDKYLYCEDVYVGVARKNNNWKISFEKNISKKLKEDSLTLWQKYLKEL